MRGHVGAETIAAFREDLLSRRKAARVAAHLAVCPQCAGVDAQLGAVTAVLAAVPAPQMPASLAARIEAALATEAAARAAGAAAEGTAPTPGAVPHATGAPGTFPAAPAPGTVGPAGTTRPAGTAPRAAGPAPRASGAARPGRAPRHAAGPDRAGRWSSPLVLRLAAATAAVVVLGGGGYVIARVVAGGSSGFTASSAGSPGSGAAAEPSAARRPAMTLAPEAGRPALGTAGLPVVASGTDYQPGQERAQVARVLRDNPTPGRTAGTRHASPAAAGFPRLAACVAAVTGGGQPRLVDIARYRGRPAAVIVLPVAGSQTVRVWIVGTGCPAHGGDVITAFTMAAAG